MVPCTFILLKSYQSTLDEKRHLEDGGEKKEVFFFFGMRNPFLLSGSCKLLGFYHWLEKHECDCVALCFGMCKINNAMWLSKPLKKKHKKNCWLRTSYQKRRCLVRLYVLIVDVSAVRRGGTIWK